MAEQDIVAEARELRQTLHGCAELSFAETKTAKTVTQWFEARGMKVTSGVGKTGVVVEVAGSEPGPVRLFRADLDAIGTSGGGAEVNLGVVPEPSGKEAEHVCGHDGHSAMLAGALLALSRAPERWSGRVLGVFQPAEEIGEGAQAMLEHAALDREVDEAYAVHNEPGLALGTVGISTGVAALASTGLVVSMKGRTTHASTPHKGNAAISAMATFIRELLALPTYVVPFGGSVLITPTYLDAGERQFGRVPPRAEMGAVARSNSDECLETVLREARQRLDGLCGSYGLEGSFELVEPFPATINDRGLAEQAYSTLGDAGLSVVFRDNAQPWSEDFGYFLQRWPGALMLLGAGEDHPSLHSHDYEFPDALLGPGIDMWTALAGLPAAS